MRTQLNDLMNESNLSIQINQQKKQYITNKIKDRLNDFEMKVQNAQNISRIQQSIMNT